MVSEKSIVGSLKNLKTGINGMVRKTPKITPETTIYEAARLMVENQTRQLPVFEKEKVKGVVTTESLMQSAVDTEFGNKPVSVHDERRRRFAGRRRPRGQADQRPAGGRHLPGAGALERQAGRHRDAA